MKQLVLSPALQADLQHVEQLILERIKSHSAVMNVAGRYLLNSGGKRLRALLALVCARFGQNEPASAVHAAIAVELIHTASLVHDDLVDEAERRRGVVTVHTRWDHGVALLVGDYFFALAAAEMALSPDPRIITYFAHAAMTICEGELSPVMTTTPLETALEQYYYKIGCKTAALFASACKAGMASGGGTDEQINAMECFGNDLGLAFQVVDDILDFVGDEQTLGKPAGSDMRRGIITLPLIYAVAATQDERLAAVVDTQDEDEIQWAIGRVKRYGIEPSREAARSLIDRALTYLNIFPESEPHQILSDVATFVLERDR
ncbi:MAG: polyprenyl synthetase family protein [Chloroflexaceae bacterium]|nr:polyprenyl synthetase family protein [Chloroflexaceae bacterium]